MAARKQRGQGVGIEKMNPLRASPQWPISSRLVPSAYSYHPGCPFKLGWTCIVFINHNPIISPLNLPALRQKLLEDTLYSNLIHAYIYLWIHFYSLFMSLSPFNLEIFILYFQENFLYYLFDFFPSLFFLAFISRIPVWIDFHGWFSIFHIIFSLIFNPFILLSYFQ